VLLTWSPRDHKLINQWAMDHTTTLAGGQPILALDMYEHSYHIDYGANAAAYVDAFMAAVNCRLSVARSARCNPEASATKCAVAISIAVVVVASAIAGQT
jgi:Fe-Mn family superoxide dismutase